MLSSRKAYKWFYNHVQSRYYNLAMKWCYVPLGGEEKCRRELISPVTFSPNDRILDMCCGTGGATFAIATKAGPRCQIIGIDLSFGQVEAAQRNCRYDNVIFLLGDAAASSFKEHSFDKVFITHALHEMELDTRLKVLSEAKKVLREKGQIIILELDNPPSLFVRLFIGFWFLYWLPFNFETPTRRDMLRRGLTRELAEAGFTNIRKISKCRGIFQVVFGEK